MCQDPRKEQQWGTALPNIWRFQSDPQYEVLKDADAEIKLVQWEKLRQVDFKDGDQFFQQFKELAFYADVRGNEQVMVTQIKRAACEPVKTLYMQLTAIYQPSMINGRLDYYGSTTIGDSSRQKARVGTWLQVTSVENDRAKGSSIDKCTNTEDSVGNHIRRTGVPMDISAATAMIKCYRCRKLGHFKCDCPNAPKTREEALRQLNTYWTIIQQQRQWQQLQR